MVTKSSTQDESAVEIKANDWPLQSIHPQMGAAGAPLLVGAGHESGGSDGGAA
jgi:hypothetical protein